MFQEDTDFLNMSRYLFYWETVCLHILREGTRLDREIGIWRTDGSKRGGWREDQALDLLSAMGSHLDLIYEDGMVS